MRSTCRPWMRLSKRNSSTKLEEELEEEIIEEALEEAAEIEAVAEAIEEVVEAELEAQEEADAEVDADKKQVRTFPQTPFVLGLQARFRAVTPTRRGFARLREDRVHLLANTRSPRDVLGSTRWGR